MILDAVLSLIASKGLSETTYRNVSKLSGVPLGSMTYYFSSRDELIYAAFQQYAQRSLARMVLVTDNGSADLSESLSRLVTRESDAERREDRILLAELYVLSFRDKRYADLTRDWMQEAKRALQRAGVANARVVDAVQEGLTLQRCFAPEEVTEAVVLAAFRSVVEAVPGHSQQHG